MGSIPRIITDESKASVDFRAINEASRHIGVHEMTLGNWRRKLRLAQRRAVGSCHRGRVARGADLQRLHPGPL